MYCPTIDPRWSFFVPIAEVGCPLALSRTHIPEPVHGNAILVDGQVYHRGHLRCSECLLAIDKFYYLLTHAELVAEPSPIVVLENDEISEGRRRKPIARPASSPGKKTIVCSRCKASGHPICAGNLFHFEQYNIELQRATSLSTRHISQP